MKFTNLYKSQTSLNERRFIYNESEPGLIDAVGQVAGAASKVFDSGARLVGSIADVTATAAGVVTNSVDYVTKKVGKAIEWIENPGEPNTNLPLYNEFEKVFPEKSIPKLSGAAQTALNYHVRIAYINYKVQQANVFHEYALEDFAKAEKMINEVHKKRERSARAIAKLRASIQKIEAEINSGRHSEHDARTGKDLTLPMLRRKLASQNAQLNELVSDDDFIVEWNMPYELACKSPYDPDGGLTVMRYKRAKKRKKIDVRKLHSYFQVYFAGHDVQMAQYKEESIRWAYKKEKILSRVDTSDSWLNPFDESDKAKYVKAQAKVDQMMKKAVRGVKIVKKRGAKGKELTHLLPESAAKAASRPKTKMLSVDYMLNQL